MGGEALIGVGLGEVALDVREALGKAVEDLRIRLLTGGCLDRLAGVLAQILVLAAFSLGHFAGLGMTQRPAGPPNGMGRPGRSVLASNSASRTSERYANTFTARAITRPRITSEISACRAIVALAHSASGMASVGLKAVALVKPR